jgi:hypothetical protein
MHSAERVMRTLCSPRSRIFPIAFALFSGALVLLLDCVTRVLQVLVFQFYDFPSEYHVWMCLEYAEDLNGQYTAMKRGPKSNASWK